MSLQATTGNLQIAGTFTSGGNIASTGSSLSIGTTTVRVINGPYTSGNVGLEANSTSYGCYMQGGTTNYAYFNNTKTVLNRRMEILASTSNGSTTPNISSLGALTGGTAYNYHMLFKQADGSVKGQITNNTYGTQYTTSSDYRLKENVQPLSSATSRTLALNPCTFEWIDDADNNLIEGFIAHEVQAIVPDAVVGEKDAMTAPTLYLEGEELPEGVSVGDIKVASAPHYQTIDQSKLIPILVKTIQELEARITALESA